MNDPSEVAPDLLAAAKDYADEIVKPPLAQIGGILADTVGYWRLKNRVNILLKARAYCRGKGVDHAKMLPSVFVPLMDEAGNTDDECLSEMFARLLASHLDPNSRENVHPSFAKVLGQLSPLDSKMLAIVDEKEQTVWKHRKELSKQGVKATWSPLSAIDIAKNKLGSEISAGEYRLSLENLMRLGLCEDNTLIFELSDVRAEPEGFVISKYGNRFLCACNGPDYWRRKLLDRDERMYLLRTESAKRPSPTEQLNERLKAMQNTHR